MGTYLNIKHYDPLDYVFGGTTVNANITFTAGTAVGWFEGSGTDYGIRMGNSQIASFQGTVTSPVWWVRGNTVKEQGGSVVWPGAGATGGLVGEASSFAQSPQANLLFTHCSILGFGDGGRLNHFRDDGGYLIVNAEHSEFYGGACGSNGISCYFSNCLLDRVLLAQVQGWPGNAFILTNCTFHGGSLYLTPYSNAIPIYIHDCAFDGTSLIVSNYGTNTSTYTNVNYNYNAFTNNTAGRSPIGGTNDIIVTNGFNWQTSWFGNYYLPSGSLLTNAGDVTANVVGLYHFTTQTSQVPETNSVVDIGYHYVATDANGNPRDTIVPGIPDYLAYPNGSPPVITTQPLSQAVNAGTNASFSVAATGTTPLAYQWKFNGTNLAGATQNTVSITNVQSWNTGSYSVVITNVLGSATSTNAILLLGLQFSISVTNQFVAASTVPVNIGVLSGVPASFAVLVDSTNFASATWTAYSSSNITVNVGSTQGLHNVWVGLQGLPPVSQQVWNETTVFLDSHTPTISITNPVNNASFNASRVNINGNFAAPSVQSIVVNGLLAFIKGTNFEAVNVPLNDGANLITATLFDSTMLTNVSSINITTTTNSDGSLNNPVQLQATPVAGFNPAAVVFQPQTNIPGVTQVVYDFVGADIPAFTNNSLNAYTYTYTTNGQYYPVVTVQTPVARFSSIGGWNAFLANPTNSPVRVTVLPPPTALTVTNINGLASVINIANPVDLKWTATSNLYVLSGSTATITEFDTNGNIVRALSGIGSNPTGLDVDASGNIYVAMNGANQVWRFKPTSGSFAADTTFGTNGSGYIGLASGASGTNAGQFNAPYDVAVAADNSVLSVTDSGNNRVQQFSTGGVFGDVFGGSGSSLGQFNAPKGITYDSANYWYVVDSGNNRVVQGRDDYPTGAGGTNGTALAQFNGPLNLSVGVRGLYVADTGNNRVQGFDLSSDGETDNFELDASTVRIAASSGLNHPAAVAAVNNLTNDMFYIADTGNNRVILYAIGTDNPAAVWNSMIAQLQAGNILGAVSFFSATTEDDYQHDFLAIGLPELIPVMNAVGPLTPVYIYGNKAQYYFAQMIQGVNITFPVGFDRDNGLLKIHEF